jgi:4-alpha-glucanotransferase
MTVTDGGISGDHLLPLGYHRLRLSPGDHSALIISAPEIAAAAPRRALGVVAPIYSMRAANKDTGIGNFGHLRQLADFALASGAAVVGTLPLVATFPDQPSPYSPASRRAWNELLVDLAAAPGWNGSLPANPDEALWVDYERTGRDIRSAIAQYVAHTHDLPQLRSRIERFATDNPEIVRYAAFRARCDLHGRNWRTWPSGASAPPDRIDYHLTAQWLATEQLGTLGATLRERDQYLYLDLPIGCHPDGYDIWDQPEIYAPASVGAPPDSLFLGGQDWGLPATIPEQSRRDGHQAFIKAVHHQLSAAGLLRIDHVMGLHRTWWVPHGLTSTHGAYVMQPTDEMLAIVCLESHRAGTAVIGENLGTVPPAVATALERHHLLGMKVTQDGLDEPAVDELIALSTHDTPPFAAWWNGTDITDGEDLGVYADGRGDIARADRADTIGYLEEILSTSGLGDTRDGILEWMAASQAAVAIVNIDDLWAEERRQNVPGTDAERPNWRARHAYPMETVTTDGHIRSQLERLHQLRNADQTG